MNTAAAIALGVVGGAVLVGGVMYLMREDGTLVEAEPKPNQDILDQCERYTDMLDSKELKRFGKDINGRIKDQTKRNKAKAELREAKALARKKRRDARIEHIATDINAKREAKVDVSTAQDGKVDVVTKKDAA